MTASIRKLSLFSIALLLLPALAFAQEIAAAPADAGLNDVLAAFNAHNWPLLAGLLVSFSVLQIQKGAWHFDTVSEALSHWLHSTIGTAALASLGGIATALVDGAISGWSWSTFVPGAFAAVVGFIGIWIRQLAPTAGKAAQLAASV
jgi:hypothetical protein